jgi:hypothetical protein
MENLEKKSKKKVTGFTEEWMLRLMMDFSSESAL